MQLELHVAIKYKDKHAHLSFAAVNSAAEPSAAAPRTAAPRPGCRTAAAAACSTAPPSGPGAVWHPRHLSNSASETRLERNLIFQTFFSTSFTTAILEFPGKKHKSV